MKPSERFEKVNEEFPTPWKIVCQYVAGEYIPVEIVDSNNIKVMSCSWGAATKEGKNLYACIVESMQDRIKYGNPW